MSDPAGPSQPSPGPRLSPADGRALDALVESGWTPAHDDNHVDPHQAKRAEKLAALLVLLQPPPPAAGAKQDLVNLTMARILRAKPAAAPSRASLIPDDEEALDALIACGMDPEQTPASLRERARIHAELASLVARGPADRAGSLSPAKSDLIERTLRAVEAQRASELQGLPRFERARGRGRTLSLRDLVSVAAVMTIGASVVWPVAAGLRHAQRQALCGSNLASAAGGFGMYAGVHRDALPMAAAGLGGGLQGVGNAIGRWWDVGNRQAPSNSANLYTLTRTGFAPLASLACPGNPNAPTVERGPDEIDWRSLPEVSYSYQIMFGAPPPAWKKGPGDVILADRSPVVLRAVRGDWIDPLESSPNHLARGQHLLRADGSARWAEKPVCEDGDNIWLPRVIEQAIRDVAASRRLRPIDGRETPSDAHDTFLGP